LEEIAHLVHKYGFLFYGFTFLWTFIEGETFVIFAGALSVPGIGGFATPPINIYLLILAAWIGSFAGDQLYFFMGRRFGKRILHRFPRIEGGVHIAIELLEKYHTVFILTYRYMYGVRNFASLGMGMTDLSWPRFVALNFISAFLWANSFAWGGYALGHFAAGLLGEINFIWFMVGVMVFVFGLFAVLHWRGKKRFKRRLAHDGRARDPQAGPPAGAQAGGAPAGANQPGANRQ
jgi:membrane protein DedA with SNARE-associated domain